LNIYIDSSWDSGGLPRVNISQGVVLAREEWNTATDSSGNRTHYSFEQTSEQASADFIIRRGTPTSGRCAEINQAVHPHTITLSSDYDNMEADNVAAVIAHELGHRVGLSNMGSDGCPFSNSSIMNGYSGACIQNVREVSQNDVAN